MTPLDRELQARPRRRPTPWSWIWKLGLGCLVISLALLSRAGGDQQSLVWSAEGATAVCGNLPGGVTTWNAAGSPFNICPAGVTVPSGATLTIDGAGGPVQVQALGFGGIAVQGGVLQTVNTSALNNVAFNGPSATPGSWSGLSFTAGGTGSLSNASIKFASTGIFANTQAVAGVTLNAVTIDQVGGSGILGQSTVLSVTGGAISNAGQQGISTSSGNLTVSGVSFANTASDAIFASALAGKTVAITNNQITTAGTHGIYLQSPDNLTLTGNTITSSGTGTSGGTLYAAIRLDSATISIAAASGPTVANNTGGANGVNATALVNSSITNSFTWVTPQASMAPVALGTFIVGDLNLTVTPATGAIAVTAPANAIFKTTFSGTIRLNGATLDATAGGATFTGLRDNSVGMSACPNEFLGPSSCVPFAGDWNGFNMTQGPTGARGNGAFTGATMRWGSTAIFTNSGAPAGLTFADSTIDSSANGIITQSTPVAVSKSLTGTTQFTNLTGSAISASSSKLTVMGGSFNNIGGRAIDFFNADLTVDGATFSNLGQEAIGASGLSGRIVILTNNQVTGGDSYGISLNSPDNLTLTGNTILSSGAGPSGGTIYPAVRLDNAAIRLGPSADPTVNNNQGGGNGIDTILLVNTTVINSFTWVTPQAGTPAAPVQLGLMAFGSFTMNATMANPLTMTMPVGAIAKIFQGAFNLNGATLDATAGGAIFTSLRDNGNGVPACPSVIFPSPTLVCTSAPLAGDWSGIFLRAGPGGTKGNGALTGANIRFAGTGIFIDSGADGTVGSPPPSFGLVVLDSTIDMTTQHGIQAFSTPISVTKTALGTAQISNTGGRGIDFSNASLTVDGVSFSNTGAEAIGAGGLGGRLVSITNNQVSVAEAYGMYLVGPDALTLRGNTIVSSGVNPIGSLRYFAIRLDNATINLDALSDPTVTANLGGGNGIDATLLVNPVITNSFAWLTPQAGTPDLPVALGYTVFGSFTMTASAVNPLTLTMAAGAVAKIYQGALNLNGVTLDATIPGAVFTSLRDNSVGLAACPSIIFPAPDGGCTQAALVGDWSGVFLRAGAGGTRGNGALTGATIRFAGTGIFIDSGATSTVGAPTFGLAVVDSVIDRTSQHGIQSFSTPTSVSKTALGTAQISNTGARGIELSSANLTVDGVTFSNTGAEAIGASGLASRLVVITNNQISGARAYGIYLVSPDTLTLRGNTITNSGGSPIGSNRYWAVRLDSATVRLAAATDPTVINNQGGGNGINALLLVSGTVTNDFGWITPQAGTPAVPVPLGYMGFGSFNVTAPTATLLTMTVPTGGVVKISGGGLNLSGVTLDATAGGSIFSSLRDNTVGVGVPACPSVVFPSPNLACTFPPFAGDFSGISLTQNPSGAKANANLTGATLKWAGIGVSMNSGATSTVGAPGFGLVFSGTIQNNSQNAINTSGSPISITNTTIDTVFSDAVTISNLVGQANTFTGNTLRNVVGNGLTLFGNGSSTVMNGKFTGVGGVTPGNYAIRVFGPSTAAISCSTIQNNAGGVQVNTAGTTIAQSNLFGNTGTGRFDLNNTAAVDARNNWWGQATGPAAGQIANPGSAMTSPFLAAPSMCAPT